MKLLEVLRKMVDPEEFKKKSNYYREGREKNEIDS